MHNLHIRLEKPTDYRIVEELTRAAFNNPDRIDRSKIDCPMEHHMVHKLREQDGIMDLDFVAEINGKIVGHIIYSNAHVLQSDGSRIDVLNFGPISVWPELQRTGIGNALMSHSILRLPRNSDSVQSFFSDILNTIPGLGLWRPKNLELPIAMATTILPLWPWS